jgi:hypothetical protein
VCAVVDDRDYRRPATSPTSLLQEKALISYSDPIDKLKEKRSNGFGSGGTLSLRCSSAPFAKIGAFFMGGMLLEWYENVIYSFA